MNKVKRILITGGQGMLGRGLAQLFASQSVISLSHSDLDITNSAAVAKIFHDIRPNLVLHCAAITGIARCEREREHAYDVNDHGCAIIAAACSGAGCRLFAFSTSCVFDGMSQKAYSEFDQANGGQYVYGQSKWAGECAIRLNCPNHIIVRLSWLYGPGGPSFLHTLVNSIDSGQPQIQVAKDQIGNPTSTFAVARAVQALIAQPNLRGTVHVACEGKVSRYSFALAVLALVGKRQTIAIPCEQDKLPLEAKWQRNSCLETRRLHAAGLASPPSWQTDLRDFMTQEFPLQYRIPS